MHLSHPLGITLRQVVIDCNDIDTFSLQRVQICGESGYKCLTFTGFHLGNTTLMQDNTSDNLYSVVPHSECSVCSFPYDRVSLRQDIVQSLSLCKALFKLSGLASELFIRKSFHLRLHRLDPVNDRVDPLQLVLAVSTENLLYNAHII